MTKKRSPPFDKEAVEDCLSFWQPPHCSQGEPEFNQLVWDAYSSKPEALCTYLRTKDEPLPEGMRQSLARLIELLTARDRRRRLPAPRQQVAQYIEDGLRLYLNEVRQEALAAGRRTAPYGFLDKAIKVTKEKAAEYGWDAYRLDWKQIKKNVQRQSSQKPAG
jgi:hypothetical protein